MPLYTVGDIATAIDGGRIWESWIHKTTAPAPGAAGRFADLSMGAGTPKYNAYAGTQYEFTPLNASDNSAIFAGPTPASGEQKRLVGVALQSTQGTQNVPLTFTLLDYLGHYPLVDGDSTDAQPMDNAETLPRYATGAGVQCMAVVTAPMSGNADVTITYTNSDGTAGRTSSASVFGVATLGAVVSCGAATAATTKVGPFFPLAAGDGGIRSIESVQLSSASGGFMSFVLVRPLCRILVLEASTWTEKATFLDDGGVMPRIYDGAFLNFIYQTSGTGNPATVRGALTFTWS
jgi:hypothetical protein